MGKASRESKEGRSGLGPRRSEAMIPTGPKHPYFGLAKNLQAGYLAYSMGVSITTALKNYIDDDKIGPYWLELAEIVARQVPAGIMARISAEMVHLPAEMKDKPVQ